MEINFEHLQSAHCENGVTRSLLKNIGIHQITEPLAFGIASGLFFIYVPLMKINGGPMIAFRPLPGFIFKGTCKALAINVVRRKFRSKPEAEIFLNDCLASGHAVGCQVGVYYLPYFPKEYRFHFNAHNLIVYGSEDGHYLVSDPIMEFPTRLSRYELERVRFAKGTLAPRGQMYYPETGSIITTQQIKKAIRTGIETNVRNMLHIPIPFIGVKGIIFTGKRIKKWRDKLGIRQAGLYLAQLVRMQEEIGTGGGGFRFIYAAFLQEAYAYHPIDKLLVISEAFTNSGDLWRDAAVQAAGIYKGRAATQEDFNIMGDYLLEIAEMERRAFVDLSQINWQS